MCDTDSETTCEPSLQGIFSRHREFLNSSRASQGQKTQGDIEEADDGTVGDYPERQLGTPICLSLSYHLMPWLSSPLELLLSSSDASSSITRKGFYGCLPSLPKEREHIVNGTRPTGCC